MDISTATVARSDQVNADDLIGGPRTVTIVNVRPGDAEQPVWIETAEYGPGKTWRPPKSVLRILEYAWGAETDNWPKHARVTLYRDDTVKFGRDAVGGIRISHMSGIKGEMNIMLTTARGKRSPFKVQPLPDAPARQQQGPDLGALTAALHAANITDPAAMTAECQRITGRQLSSARDLTAAEVQQIVDALAGATDGPTSPEGAP